MPTSGTSSFNQTRDQISTDALQLLGVYGQGDTPSTNDLNFCANILNKMVKAWEGQGIHLWTYSEAASFLTTGQQSYTITSSASDICGDNPVFALLTAAASGTSLTVDSNVGMSVNDNIGIKLDNNTLQWTTIQSLSGTTGITLNASVSSTASSGNNIFSFTNRTNIPLWITSARFRNSSGSERPLVIWGRDQFQQIPLKSATGKATTMYYCPAVSSSTLLLWPTADDVGDCIRFTYVRRIQDFNSSSDNPDLPQEWLEAITYNLVPRIAPAYGKDLAKMNPGLIQLAQSSLMQMQLWDAEDGSTNVVPNYRWDDC